jgi:outer membrane protein OmpA-like peptidoglycan-associated protein
VAGHASGLGDTRDNVTLSEARAKYVAELLSTLYHIQIPKNKITPKGEPRKKGNDKDNNPNDRRADVTVKIQYK